ncbi:hypothetical protein [Rhizobium leguminosarum]|nr:hypothetical protein [Rhizobium leguminosarum]
MFKPIGAIVREGLFSGARTAGTSCPQPVRGESRLAGSCEAGFWRPTTRKHTQQIVAAARRYDVTMRQRGARNGPLGHVAIEVLQLLANLVDFKTGRLEPSLKFIMQKLHRSKDAVHRALKALRAHGFLGWLRRYVPTGSEGKGPKVQQTSNAYYLCLPERARRLLEGWAAASPLPDDVAHARAAKAAEIAAYAKTLPLDEWALSMLGDTSEGRAFAKLAKAMTADKKRESARQAEFHTGYLSKRI